MPYRFKSVSGFDLYHNRSGINFTSGLYIEVDGLDIILASTCPQVSGWLNSGQMVFNDGSRDFPKIEALDHLKWSGIAKELAFDNATNGFVSQKVQPAIEEARSTALGKPRFCVSCGFDGTASSGRYLEYNSNVDSNQSGFVVPVPCVLRELSLCLNTAGTVTFQILKWNGTTETLLTSISTSSARKSSVVDLNIALVALDELRVKCSSGSGARPICFQFFQVS